MLLREMEQLDLRMANFLYQGEIKFGSRDNNVVDDGKTRYFAMYKEMMKREENAQRELKSIYFANYKETSHGDFNAISLLKLIVH